MSEAEVWKSIPGFHRYEASTEGRIRNARTGRVLVGTVTKKGYRQYNLRGPRGRRVELGHRLVAATFFGPPPRNCFVDLQNGDRLDCRPANLAYARPTASANRHRP